MFSASNSALALSTGLLMVGVQTIGGTDSPMINARALATTSSMVCPTEVHACEADETYAACVVVIGETGDECFTSLDSSATTCDDVRDALCCSLATEDACHNNSDFEVLLGTEAL